MKLVCQNFRTIFVRNGPFWVGPRIAKRKPTVIHAMIEFSCFRGLKDCIYFMTFAHHIAHCLGMNYYVKFLRGIGSNKFHIKLIFGT